MSKAVITFVFLVVSAASLSNQDILQQALNGVFSQNWLPNPTATIDCIDETTSKQIVDFIDASLEKLAKGSISDILPVLKRISTYTDELPPQVTDCLYEDDELWNLFAILINRLSHKLVRDPNLQTKLKLDLFPNPSKQITLANNPQHPLQQLK